MIPLTNPDKKSIKSLVNKSFDPISQKIDNLITNKTQKEVNVLELEIEQKFRNAELQLNNIINTYNKISKNELSYEDIYIFSYKLLNLYNKANKIYNIREIFDIPKKSLDYSIELMKNDNIHDKTIGIDMFIGIAHSETVLLIILITLNAGINIFLIRNIESEDKYFNWQDKISNDIIDKLNEIRNRKELPEIITGLEVITLLDESEIDNHTRIYDN